ncbi:MAG: ATP-binding protein [Parachlamydiales bacterium]|nr:ATP-binding protein [Parachlamydiales bacterium]
MDSSNRISFVIRNRIEEAHLVRSSVQAICVEAMIDSKDAFQIASCVIEIITEAITQSLNNQTDQKIEVDMVVEKDFIRLVFRYGGKEIDPKRIEQLNHLTSKSNAMETKELGFYLLKINLDKVEYAFDHGKNIWILEKKVKAYGAPAR